jgi:hypothetical protein
MKRRDEDKGKEEEKIDWKEGKDEERRIGRREEYSII